MKKSILFNFTVDKSTNSILVERSFAAPVDMVWAAWTQAEILDQWWAPKPWKVVTKHMDFSEGGYWLYAMTSPEGEIHWSRADYLQINLMKNFTGKDGFCDAEGVYNESLPITHWKTGFEAQDEDCTVVEIRLTFDQLSDLEKTIEMGFREGFTAGLENLDHYLSTRFQLRQAAKANNRARVTTYLNFPGKTEEAFLFYQKVFNGTFTGMGLKRFGDTVLPEGHPPMSEADQQLIIHAELTIMAGHVLMATDAPESMGFKMEYGNNMHINLEPETREETARLFSELSEGGQVEMPLQDMFWGAYFASFKDRYGINWMLNHQSPAHQS